MEEIKNFIVANWQYISICLVVILDIVLILIKRRPQDIDGFKLAFSEVISDIPLIVSNAEAKYQQGKLKDGVSKKNYVVSCCIDMLKSKLGRSLSSSEIKIADASISEAVEVVLTTPQKKGV